MSSSSPSPHSDSRSHLVDKFTEIPFPFFIDNLKYNNMLLLVLKIFFVKITRSINTYLCGTPPRSVSRRDTTRRLIQGLLIALLPG